MKKNFFIEFNRMATQLSGGSKDMLNRVMPKDNIAVGMILECVGTKQQVFVWNAHLTWDPEFKVRAHANCLPTLHTSGTNVLATWHVFVFVECVCNGH